MRTLNFTCKLLQGTCKFVILLAHVNSPFLGTICKFVLSNKAQRKEGL